MRRLPVYLLIDTSGSMNGEPIESVKVGIESMITTLRQDPYALETVNISIITYDKDARVLLPLTPLEELKLPEITTPESGPTHTGAALEKLCRQVEQEVSLSTPEQKGDWMPLLFIMTDGYPSDIMQYNQIIPKVKKKKFASIVACAAGMKAHIEPLKRLTDQVYSLDTMDSSSFKKFFKWVSDLIEVGNKSVGATEELILLPPPKEMNRII